MKRIFAGLIVSAAAVLAAAQDRTIWKTQSPIEGARPTRIAIEGQTLTYYALDGDGAGVRLKGPTRLRVQARAVFEETAPESLEFTLSVLVDGKEAAARKCSSRRSDSSTYAENGHGSKPGIRHSLTVDVPEGEHVLVVKSDRPAHGTFQRASKQKRSLRTEMTPAEFERAAAEIYEERERTWYFAKKDKPVVVEVIGPTTLDVYASLTFDASMRKEQEYHVEVVMDGTPAQEKAFKSSRSHVRSYPDDKSLIPGQQDDFQFKVPEGKHRVELRPRGEHSVAFRVLIPTKDLKNAAK